MTEIRKTRNYIKDSKHLNFVNIIIVLHKKFIVFHYE